MKIKLICQATTSLRNFALQFWIVRTLSVYDLGNLAAFQFLILGISIFFNNVFLTYILRSNLDNVAYRILTNFCIFSLFMNYAVIFFPISIVAYLYFDNIFILLASIVMLLDLLIRSTYYRKDQWKKFLIITSVMNGLIIVATFYSYFVHLNHTKIFILVISAILFNIMIGFLGITFNLRKRLFRKSSIFICAYWIFRNKHLLNISLIQNISALLSFLTIFIPGATYYLGILRIVQVILSPLNVVINLLEVKFVSDLQINNGKMQSLKSNLMLGAAAILIYLVLTQIFFEKLLLLLNLNEIWSDSFLMYLIILTGYLIFNILDSQLNILGKVLKQEKVLSKVGTFVVGLHLLFLLYILVSSQVALIPLIVGIPVIVSCTLKLFYLKDDIYAPYS